MALKLQLDGQEIGEMNTDTGEVRDTEGQKVPGDKVKPETMEVPLEISPRRRRASQEIEEEEKETDEEETTEDEEDEDKLLNHPAFKTLMDGQTRLQQQLRQLAQLQNRNKSNEEQVDFLKEEFLNDEKDPTGMARTVKALAKQVANLSKLGEQVGRLDTHMGYTEAQKLLNEEKSRYPVFKDKVTGAVADRLLRAELQLNNEDDMATIVRNVAREVKKLRPERAVRDKAEQREKLPAGGGTRRSEGVSPSVTVNKPKSLEDARKAYQAWKGARARAHNRG